MLKKLGKVLIAIILVFSILYSCEEPTSAASKTETFTFAESTSQSQTQVKYVPNLTQVSSVKVDNGSVSYTVSGDNITFKLSNGTGKKVQTGGTYTPADSKTVTDKKSTDTGGDPNKLPSSIAYNSGGYTGTLTKSGAATVTSGNYTPADTKQTSITQQAVFVCDWVSNSNTTVSWSAGGDWKISPETISYNSGGYTGILPWTDQTHSSCDTVKPTNTAPVGTHKNPTTSATVTYSGSVSKPASDTRIWTQNYSGTVTKPAVDTRTYETRYQYKVEVSYLYYSGTSPNIASNDGISLNGINQFFRIKDSPQYKIDKNVSIGVMFKPTSTSISSRQNLLSDTEGGGIALTLQPSGMVWYVYINGSYQTITTPLSVIGLNKWNYAMLTYNGETLNVYLNGEQVGSLSVTGSITYPSMDWLIGAEPDANSTQYYFKGQIENVRLWNRVLNTTELTSASKGTYPMSGLVGGWKFDSIANGVVYDISSYKNNAIGENFNTASSLNFSNVNDLGATITWNSLGSGVSYELKRDGASVYRGTGTSLTEDGLVSDTSYTYSITPKNVNGEGVPDIKSFKTLVGSLEVLSVPSNISLTPITLNGTTQTTYGTFGQNIIVKDTRKTRNGWKLVATSSNFTSSDGKRSFPSNSIKLKAISSIVQTKGLKQDSPTIINKTQNIDINGGATLVSASSTTTGYGIYEITLPTNALEISLNPSYGYVNSNGSPLSYNADITWKVVEGN